MQIEITNEVMAVPRVQHYYRIILALDPTGSVLTGVFRSPVAGFEIESGLVCFAARNVHACRALPYYKRPQPRGASSKIKDSIMRTMTQALLALGFVGAMAVSTPVTTEAQGIYFSGSSVGVGIGNRPDRYRYTRRYYRDYENSYAYDRRPYSQRYYNSGYNGFSRYGGVYNFPYDRRTYY